MKKALLVLLAMLTSSCSSSIPSFDMFNIQDQTGQIHKYARLPQPPESLMCYIHMIEEFVEVKTSDLQIKSR